MALPEDVMSELESSQWKELFDKVDTDNDGYIAAGDIKQLAASAGREITDEQAQVNFQYSNVLSSLDPSFLCLFLHFCLLFYLLQVISIIFIQFLVIFFSHNAD